MTAKEILLLVAARRYAADGTGRAIRKSAGLSMAEVAEAVGVSEPTIWRWEERKHRPRGAAAIRWADLLQQLKADTRKATA
jgi:transcriptional regulator with XRE-family HTH domain